MSKNIKLENFSGIAVELKFDDIFDKHAMDCVDRLKNIPWDNAKARKPYNDGWTVIERGNSVIVWNETNWQLTWLLENGHLITNKRDGVGWANAHPHIRPTFESVKGAFIHDVEHNTKVKLK